MSATPRFIIPAIARPFDVQVTLPGSKSIALRQLAMSALTSGTSIVRGIPECDDTAAMLDCLAALGCTVAPAEITGSSPADALTREDAFAVTGPMNLTDDVTLEARMSGASTRLLLGLAAIRSGRTQIDGHSSLRVRTNAPLYEVLSRYGCTVESEDGGLPVTVQGPLKIGAGQNEPLRIDGSLSSQYITALLVVAPLFGGTQRIEISGDLVSRPYIDITLSEMRKRGAQAGWKSARVLEITPEPYRNGEFTVEGDATAATYFSALATLHGGSITLDNIGTSTHQGDYGFMEVMASIGAEVDASDHATTIRGRGLLPLEPIDMTTMPDAALTLIAMGPLLPSGASINGLSSLHHKECDRLLCPVAEFKEMGITVAATEDSIQIEPIAADQIRPHTLNTYHDHRMAMAFSLLGSVTGHLGVDDPAVVNKTFPAYWEAYARLVENGPEVSR